MSKSASKKIIDILVEHLGDNLRLLFMPYKRDMWDSLEGIYNIAIERGFTADITPIPYTCKDADGSFNDWIMDDFTGENVIYKFPEKGKYDAIFIHNSYDDHNKITSILPCFYSQYLKGLSRALCLVPYGIGDSGMVTPGILNADVVFPESEKAVDSIMEDADRLGINVEKFRKKFYVVGSTKYDSLMPDTIPDSWKDRIKGKTVYLIATSIVPLLADPFGEMKKIDDIIRKNALRPDVCLIWREHPLLKATIHSMIPELEKAYQDYQRYYISNDLGILDTTDDYRIAFNIADVLYTDSGSLAKVWEKTGKELNRI